MTKNAKVPANTAADVVVVTSIKGFDKDLKCRGYRFTLGGTFTHDGKVEACHGGFHAIEGHPLEVFDYYAPAASRYAEVQQSGDLSRHGGDSKLASAKITIGVELSISDLVARAVKWVFDRSKPEGEVATGDRGAASATGDRGAASATGYRGAASATGTQGAASATGTQGAASATGDRGAASATGDRGAASATGYRGAASATGYQGAASATGTQGAASATGTQGAASATGDRGAASATGDRGAASATGYRGAASATGTQGAASATGTQGAASATGTQGAASATGARGAASATGTWGTASATGEKSCAAAFGYEGRARGVDGGAIFLVCRDDVGNILCVRASKVGENGVKAGVWYQLSAEGEFVEVPS